MTPVTQVVATLFVAFLFIAVFALNGVMGGLLVQLATNPATKALCALLFFGNLFLSLVGVYAWLRWFVDKFAH